MKTLFSNARIINPETLSDTLGSVLIENETIEFKIEDFAVLCSNCHRMIHRKKPWKTIQEMKSLNPLDFFGLNRNQF